MYIPQISKLISNIHDKTLGDLKMLSIREHRFPFLVKVNDWNRFNNYSYLILCKKHLVRLIILIVFLLYTGGTLVEKCCHFFDLMRLIIKSEPVRVFASGN